MKFIRLQNHIVDITGVNYVNWQQTTYDKSKFVINLFNVSGNTLAVSFDDQQSCEDAFQKIADVLESMVSAGP